MRRYLGLAMFALAVSAPTSATTLRDLPEPKTLTPDELRVWHKAMRLCEEIMLMHNDEQDRGVPFEYSYKVSIGSKPEVITCTGRKANELHQRTD